MNPDPVALEIYGISLVLENLQFSCGVDENFLVKILTSNLTKSVYMNNLNKIMKYQNPQID